MRVVALTRMFLRFGYTKASPTSSRHARRRRTRLSLVRAEGGAELELKVSPANSVSPISPA